MELLIQWHLLTHRLGRYMWATLPGICLRPGSSIVPAQVWLGRGGSLRRAGCWAVGTHVVLHAFCVLMYHVAWAKFYCILGYMVYLFQSGVCIAPNFGFHHLPVFNRLNEKILRILGNLWTCGLSGPAVGCSAKIGLSSQDNEKICIKCLLGALSFCISPNWPLSTRCVDCAPKEFPVSWEEEVL